jgi:hypothetical protein
MRSLLPETQCPQQSNACPKKSQTARLRDWNNVGEAQPTAHFERNDVTIYMRDGALVQNRFGSAVY